MASSSIFYIITMPEENPKCGDVIVILLRNHMPLVQKLKIAPSAALCLDWLAGKQFPIKGKGYNITEHLEKFRKVGVAIYIEERE